MSRYMLNEKISAGFRKGFDMSTEDDKRTQDYANGIKADIMEAYEKGELYEWFDDTLDIEFRCDCRKQLRSVSIAVTLGGPGCFVDAGSKAVRCWWGASYAESWLPSKVCEKIEDIFEVYWNCLE